MNHYQLHPDFPEEAGMYLETNGFKRAENEDSRHISFFTDSKAVIATGNSIQFLELQDEEYGQRSKGFAVVATYSGIQNIPGMFEWMMLFHLAGCVRLKDYMKIAKKEGLITSPDEVLNLFGHNAIAANF